MCAMVISAGESAEEKVEILRTAGVGIIYRPLLKPVFVVFSIDQSVEACREANGGCDSGFNLTVICTAFSSET